MFVLLILRKKRRVACKWLSEINLHIDYIDPGKKMQKKNIFKPLNSLPQAIESKVACISSFLPKITGC